MKTFIERAKIMYYKDLVNIKKNPVTNLWRSIQIHGNYNKKNCIKEVVTQDKNIITKRTLLKPIITFYIALKKSSK